VTAATATRNAPVAVTALLVLLGALFVVIGVIYFADTANALPAFFPGHQAGSAHHHSKHGIAAFVIAVLCWVGAWFSTGRRAA
jgi:hypothetical protein